MEFRLQHAKPREDMPVHKWMVMWKIPDIFQKTNWFWKPNRQCGESQSEAGTQYSGKLLLPEKHSKLSVLYAIG